MTGLKKFAVDIDPYMHYKGKIPKKRINSDNIACPKIMTNFFFWEKCGNFICFHRSLPIWGNLAKNHNREKVFCAIRLFLETRNEILDILERIDRKSESDSFVST